MSGGGGALTSLPLISAWISAHHGAEGPRYGVQYRGGIDRNVTVLKTFDCTLAQGLRHWRSLLVYSLCAIKNCFSSLNWSSFGQRTASSSQRSKPTVLVIVEVLQEHKESVLVAAQDPRDFRWLVRVRHEDLSSVSIVCYLSDEANEFRAFESRATPAFQSTASPS